MKKSGILNAQLIRCIAELGHKDLFMIGDAGMPIPKGVEIVDLVVCGQLKERCKISSPYFAASSLVNLYAGNATPALKIMFG